MIHLSLIIESIVVISLIALLSIKLRVLDVLGTITAAIIGIIIYFTIGRIGIVALCIFMFISGLTTRIGYEYKKSIGAAESKTGIRGWRNVLGNGLIAIFFSIYSILTFHSSSLPLVGFIGSVSAVFADTLATEVGLLYRGPTRLIIGLKQTRPGTPGGVTTYGYAGAFFSTLILTASLAPFLINNKSLTLTKLALITLVSGIGGTTIDSIVGQLLQAVYRCPICHSITEDYIHCNTRCEKIKGISYINNHVVNIICSAFGGLTALVLYNTF